MIQAPVILASKSAARAAVLRGAGVLFETRDAGVDEDILKAEMLSRGAGPAEVAVALAREKALAVSQSNPGFVIGADQTLDFQGRLYDKPQSLQSAAERLRAMRGLPHALHSAVSVARKGEIVWQTLSSAELDMRDFTDAFLNDYLALEGPDLLTSVGAYRLEGRGVQLFSDIRGDYFTILGLPLPGLLAFLREEGVLLS